MVGNILEHLTGVISLKKIFCEFSIFFKRNADRYWDKFVSTNGDSQYQSLDYIILKSFPLTFATFSILSWDDIIDKLW